MVEYASVDKYLDNWLNFWSNPNYQEWFAAFWDEMYEFSKEGSENGDSDMEVDTSDSYVDEMNT